MRPHPVSAKAHTVNCEYFVVKIFSDSLACAKLNAQKYIHNINDNVVQGRLSENYLTRKILDTKYSQFTVLLISTCWFTALSIHY